MISPASDALNKMLGRVAECLTPESAQRMSQLQIATETRARIDELAEKAEEGQLTDAERAEYVDYVEAMDLIGILQAKARQILVRPTGS